MKLKLPLFLLLIFIFLFLGCKNDGNPLNGLWSGFYEDGLGENIKLSLAFKDDLCFMFYEAGDNTSVRRNSFTYENGVGNMSVSMHETIQFFVNGNILNFVRDGIQIVLEKDRVSKPAPLALNRVWTDIEGWTIIFVHDRAFIHGLSTDYGNYIFNDRRGSFKTAQYEALVEFELNGKSLDVKVNDYAQTFSRVN